MKLGSLLLAAGALALAVQPWQVNPPSQFLNTTGGFSPINALALGNGVATVNGRASLRFTSPDAVMASRFDTGLVRERMEFRAALEVGLAQRAFAVLAWLRQKRWASTAPSAEWSPPRPLAMS